ncbi:MAG: hypothetical protein ACRCYC_10260 [Paraclostridium sp.]|uniref:hypothetical protein n=1 Tax=Paraclostridium sp. TaxID=2023273 RepID=UPI003F3C4CA4
MKTINFNFNEFNLSTFIDDYSKDVRKVFGINNKEPLGRIVEMLNHNTLEPIFFDEPLNKEGLINKLENEEGAIFFPLGCLADESMRFFRFIDLKKYKISEGIIENNYFEEDLESDTEDILSFGNLNIDRDTSIGIVLTKINNKLFISVAQYEFGSCLSLPTLSLKENSGDLSNIVINFISRYNKSFN